MDLLARVSLESFDKPRLRQELPRIAMVAELFYLSSLCRAIFCALCGIAGAFVIPQDDSDRSVNMDWIGVFLGLAGMILFNTAWK